MCITSSIKDITFQKVKKRHSYNHAREQSELNNKHRVNKNLPGDNSVKLLQTYQNFIQYSASDNITKI